MGLRTASVRRQSSAVTMAPALTETKSTSNTFKLTPKTSAPCNQNTVTGVVDAALEDTVAAATTQTTAIIRKGIKADVEELFDLTHLQLAADLLTKGEFTLEKCKQSPPTDNGIMSNTELPIIQNPTITTTSNEMVQQQQQTAIIKDEAIVDQMFANLPCDDDLMQQVIKSIESSVGAVEEEGELPLSASDLATLPGNLSSLFNAVDMMGIEQLLVEEGGCNTGTMDHQTDDKKDVRSTELIVQVRDKQAQLERKLDFLLRRLRKMQIRYMGRHFSAEVAGVYEHVHRTLRRLKDNNQQSQSTGATAAMPSSCDLSGAAALDLSVATQSAHTQVEDVGNKGAEVLKPISHGVAKNLVKKLENTRYLQANSAARQRLSARFFGSGSIEPTSFRSTTSSATTSTPSTLTLIPTWPTADKTSLQQTASQLRTQVTLMQGQLDSDITASSSGGESCDEMTVYGNVHQQYLAIQKRAAWKYSSARASVAARWSWLLAQIADLEYRIKQHNDLQRTIRTKKGPVILSSAIPPTSIPTNTAAVNGYKGILPGDNSKDTNIATDSTCARIRPLNVSTFAKRRLVQTGGLHLVSKKAARPATVRCACAADVTSVWRGMNCAVCTGRSDPTLPRDPTEHLSRMERIALLDGGYHPVVSLPEDTSISVHMEAIMKSVDWQQRSSRSSLKAMKYAIKADRMNSDRGEKQQQAGSGCGGDRERAISGKKSGGLEHRKKYNRLSGGIKGSTVNALTAKLKSGRPRGRKPNNARHNSNTLLPPHKKHRRHSSQLQRSRERSTSHQSSYSASRLESNDDMDIEEDHYLDDRDYIDRRDRNECDGMLGQGSRSGSPLLATQSISGFGRRNRVDSYDIDNIVIPYSVAASTRVERLQYKEILTPKWRMIDDSTLPSIKYESKNNGIVKMTSQENEVSDVEDISEDAVLLRHDKSEQEEKRKFLSYLKLPFGYYSAPSHRRHLQALHHHNNNHRRTDSRAESSGANTPDNPMSPANVAGQHQQHHQGEGDTSVASPPALIEPIIGGNKGEELPESLRNLPLSSLSSLRRRTISSSSARWLQRDTNLNNDGDVPPLAPMVEISPYDGRQFPLSAENYDKMQRGMPDGHHTGMSKQPMMNVRNQDSTLEDITITSFAASTTVTSTPSNANRLASSFGIESRRSTTTAASTAQQLTDRNRHSILDDIDSESTESAFGDEDPNDPEWDMEDQISRNSHDGGVSRFRR